MDIPRSSHRKYYLGERIISVLGFGVDELMDEKMYFPGRVGIQQRVLPAYRARFFDCLAAYCFGGLSVFAGEPQPVEAIQPAGSLEHAQHAMAKNFHILGGKAYLCFQKGLLGWLEEWDPDILILEANPRYPANPPAIRWMHRRNRPAIGWGLGPGHSKGVLSGLRHWIRTSYFSAFDGLIAYSSVGAEQYAEAGISAERIHVAINSATLPPEKMPQRHSFKGRAARILYVGRLQERKRINLLLEACRLIESKPECWIVGDGPERSRLEHLAQDVYPEAKFLGSKRGSELKRFFEQADLFVLPGTGGLAVQEAMTYGLPVIVAQGDGTQRDLVSVENGWLVEPGNLEDLHRALKEALSNPEELMRKGIASYQVVRNRANIDAMAKVFLQVMSQLQAGRI